MNKYKLYKIFCSFFLLICLFMNSFKIIYAEGLTNNSELLDLNKTENDIDLTNVQTNDNLEEFDKKEQIIENISPTIEPTIEPTVVPTVVVPQKEIDDTNKIVNKLETKDENLKEDFIKDENSDILEEIKDNEKELDEIENSTMPNLVGINSDEILNTINIPTENIIIKYQIDETLPENTIISQSIIEGDKYDDNSILEIIVSSLPLEIENESNIVLDIMNCFALTTDLSEQNIGNSSEGNSNVLLDWDSVPSSYEYNWDNSSNCWENGVWVDEECYKTPQGEYSTDVRHKMQLYCNDGYVYLHIVYSRDYGSKANGNDFNFDINGQKVRFQMVDENGNSINQTYSEGTHNISVKHEGSSLSGTTADDAECYLIVDNDNNINNQLELKISMEEFAKQNPNINLNEASLIGFTTPNLMYREISCAGSSTNGFLIIVPIVIFLFFKLKGLKNNE